MADYPPRKKKKPEIAPEQVIVEGIFRGIGQLFSLLFRRGQKATGKLTAAVRLELSEHWQAVETHLAHPATHSLAVSEADKVFDATLQALEVAGSTMGERLKTAEHMFTAELYHQIWNAHKLRNTLAHEVGFQATAHEIQTATATFRKALRELGIPV